jgi:iron complex transport system ATP-binding protein
MEPGPDVLAESALSAHLTRVAIGKREILHELALQLPTGRWSAIVGPNGAGKSTLLRVLAGLLPYVGDVQLLGRSLTDWPTRERARAMAWLGQAEGGGDDLLAWDIVMLGRLPHRPWLAAPNAADRAAVAGALRATESWTLRDRRLGELTGGERQRVLLSRVLAVQARVLLMDEPGNALDLAALQALEELLAAWPGALLMVSHDTHLLQALRPTQVLQVGDAGWQWRDAL